MKLFTKLLITALVLAVILPFTIIKGRDGRPLMSISDLKMPDLSMPGVPDSVDVPSLPGVSGSGRTDTVYQWRDKDGSLHFTTDPPPPGVEYTVKGYDPNANLIQSIKPESEEQVAEVESGESSDSSSAKDRGIGNPYSPERIEKLFDDAENVQKLIDERMKKQEEIFNKM
jgi:hypothetical protein